MCGVLAISSAFCEFQRRQAPGEGGGRGGAPPPASKQRYPRVTESAVLQSWKRLIQCCQQIGPALAGSRGIGSGAEAKTNSPGFCKAPQEAENCLLVEPSLLERTWGRGPQLCLPRAGEGEGHSADRWGNRQRTRACWREKETSRLASGLKDR